MDNILRKIFWAIVKRLVSAKKYAKIIGVKMGEGCVISSKKFGSEPYLITLGRRVHITQNVSFVNHDGGVWVDRENTPSFDVFGKIEIGDCSYIGNNSLILPGVTIGKNVVVGANSLVSKSIPDNTVVAGVPAKYICETIEYVERMTPLNAKTKGVNYKDKREVVTQMNHFIKKKYLLK